MPSVNIFSGIYTDTGSDFRASYPRNLVPIPMVPAITGLPSRGYLRPAEGLVSIGDGPGVDRGGINWRGFHYRVMGTKLISLNASGNLAILGDVGPGPTGNPNKQCSFTYSFDKLAIASGNRLYYLEASTFVLSQVTDPDLGEAHDVVWVDGYFMTTDGTFLIVTELNDPFSVDPLKYGSSEVDPDPVTGLLKLRDEIYALNRYTIEVFQNVGGDNFPFQRIPGAVVERGAIGTFTKVVFLDSIVFLGGGKGEAPAIWIASNGSSLNLSTREIDQRINQYTEEELQSAVMETRAMNGQKLLYVHLPNETLVYDAAATQISQTPVWYVLTSGLSNPNTYKARNFVYVYNKWYMADPTSTKYGYITNDVSTHYGQPNSWEFSTSIIYNGANGALFSSIELVCLTGRTPPGINPTIWTSYSTDGMTWSQEKAKYVGKLGDYEKRIKWFSQGFMRKWRMQRFRGTTDTQLTVSNLEMNLEPLNG